MCTFWHLFVVKFKPYISLSWSIVHVLVMGQAFGVRIARVRTPSFLEGCKFNPHSACFIDRRPFARANIYTLCPNSSGLDTGKPKRPRSTLDSFFVIPLEVRHCGRRLCHWLSTSSFAHCGWQVGGGRNAHAILSGARNACCIIKRRDRKSILRCPTIGMHVIHGHVRISL